MRGSSQRKAKNGRGDGDELDVVSQKPFVKIYKFNNFGEFLTEESPADIFEILDNYRAGANTDLVLTKDEEKKRIVIEDSKKHLKLSLKFFKLTDEDDDERLKMRFIKKAGSIEDQYELINELMAFLNDVIIEDEEEEEEEV